jgi:tRNA pseudouridine38-40 synthase
MPQAFHATLDARSKRYRYLVDNTPSASPFQLRYAWHVPRTLDVDAMQRSAGALLGRHDFHSFETDWPNRSSSVRTVLDVSVARDDSAVRIEVEADGFLYNMVRTIAGTLVWVGTGKRPERWVGDVLRAENRTLAGPTAPPQGLYLLAVRYLDQPGGLDHS